VLALPLHRAGAFQPAVGCALPALQEDPMTEKSFKEELEEAAWSLPRREVKRFACHMERVLCRNDWKGGWQDCAVGYLLSRLAQEHSEVTTALLADQPLAAA
jgi:hypothetical protein